MQPFDNSQLETHGQPDENRQLNDKGPFETTGLSDHAHGRPTSGFQGIGQLLMTAVLVAIAFGAGWFGNLYVNRANIATGDQRLVLQAWNDIDQNFVVTGAIDHQKMAYAAIQAMVDSLGDTGHSRFETPEALKQEQNQLNNASTVGIGVYLSGGGQQPIKIDALIPDSPAAKSNLRPGDWIVGVNGQNVRGKTIDEVRPLIAGSGVVGSQVTLTIVRPSVSTTATFDVTLARANITAPTVVSYIIPGVNIAHIQILQFAKDADSRLRTEIQAAKAAHVRGIVLDLRDDPGGYLDQAVSVASEFIPAGSGKNVLIVRSRTGSVSQPVTAGGVATTIPVVVLVNNGTASAAEITAGSIAVDRTGVHVVGQKTFGTGTVLEPFMLGDGSALWLGTEEWLLPNGQSIYHIGYTPDQQVALPANITPVSALVAREEHLSESQILNSGDAQLLQAIQDLGGGQS